MSTADPDPGVRVSRVGSLARIALARPRRRNALDHAGWSRLAQVCAELSVDMSIRVVVLEGEGEHFCAGADVHELRANVHDRVWLRANQSHVAAALDAYAALPQPTIAAVRGSCFGGGAALAVASDFRLASASACFAVTPARLGLTYRLIECLRLSQLIGPARTREMLLLAREVEAATAAAWGLVNEAVAEEQLEGTLQDMVNALGALSGYSQRGIKTTLLKIRDGAVADDDETRRVFEDAFNAPDFLAAADAFAAKSQRHTEN